MFKIYSRQFYDDIRIIGNEIIPASAHDGDIHEDMQPCVSIPRFDETLMEKEYIYVSSPFWNDADEANFSDRMYAYKVMGSREGIEKALRKLYGKYNITV